MTAIDGNNYCSISGNKPDFSTGNTFYIKADHLHSGKHISRLTFRGVLHGYQYYNVDNQSHMIREGSYLLVNKGQTYYSEVNSVDPIESIIVAFEGEIVNDVFSNLVNSEGELLDFPFYYTQTGNFYFPEGVYQQDLQVSKILKNLKRGIIEKNKDLVFYDQLHFKLLERILKNYQKHLTKINRIQNKKKSTKLELLRRIDIARDYMNAYFMKKLTLSEISREAAMSPFHFLRTFKDLYRITPYEHITTERLRFACYLLANSRKSVAEISSEVGFESPSSFGRLFKNRLRLSPEAYRTKKSNIRI